MKILSKIRIYNFYRQTINNPLAFAEKTKILEKGVDILLQIRSESIVHQNAYRNLIGGPLIGTGRVEGGIGMPLIIISEKEKESRIYRLINIRSRHKFTINLTKVAWQRFV